MNVFVIQDAGASTRLRKLAQGLAGVHVLAFEPNDRQAREIERVGKELRLDVSVIRADLSATGSGRNELRLSDLLRDLAYEAHTVNVCLRTNGRELALIQDCLARQAFPAVRRIFIRWSLGTDPASYLQEATLQETCKGHVRLETI